MLGQFLSYSLSDTCGVDNVEKSIYAEHILGLKY